MILTYVIIFYHVQLPVLWEFINLWIVAATDFSILGYFKLVDRFYHKENDSCKKVKKNKTEHLTIVIKL